MFAVITTTDGYLDIINVESKIITYRHQRYRLSKGRIKKSIGNN